jgi:hypothetical protein
VAAAGRGTVGRRPALGHAPAPARARQALPAALTDVVSDAVAAGGGRLNLLATDGRTVPPRPTATRSTPAGTVPACWWPPSRATTCRLGARARPLPRRGLRPAAAT